MSRSARPLALVGCISIELGDAQKASRNLVCDVLSCTPFDETAGFRFGGVRMGSWLCEKNFDILLRTGEERLFNWEYQIRLICLEENLK
jgi:hypothetical protein